MPGSQAVAVIDKNALANCCFQGLVCVRICPLKPVDC